MRSAAWAARWCFDAVTASGIIGVAFVLWECRSRGASREARGGRRLGHQAMGTSAAYLKWPT
jgi:hypothetical protein